MANDTIETKTLATRVYEKLFDKLMWGEILPGQSLKLRDLEKQFGVSFMPIREALRQLEAQRLIVIEGNRSISVTSLSAEEIEELGRIRLILESELGSRAARQRDETGIPILRKLFEGVDRAGNQPRVFMAKNFEFHTAIYLHARFPNTLDMVRMIWARIVPYYVVHNISLEDETRIETNLWHNEMLECIIAQDARGMVRALRKDIERSTKLVARALRQAHAVG